MGKDNKTFSLKRDRMWRERKKESTKYVYNLPLGTGNFKLRSSDCMLETCMLLAVVMAHGHW